MLTYWWPVGGLTCGTYIDKVQWYMLPRVTVRVITVIWSASLTSLSSSMWKGEALDSNSPEIAVLWGPHFAWPEPEVSSIAFFLYLTQGSILNVIDLENLLLVLCFLQSRQNIPVPSTKNEEVTTSFSAQIQIIISKTGMFEFVG